MSKKLKFDSIAINRAEWDVDRASSMQALRVFRITHSTKAAAALLTAAALFSVTADARVPETNDSFIKIPSAVKKLPASIDVKPEFEITTVPSPKATGMELAAKLAADGGTILRPVKWIVFGEPADAPGTWEKVGEREEPSPRFDLKPGRYVVQTIYDKARTARRISVEKDKTTVMTVTLNVGALRMLSRLGAVGDTSKSAEHLVYRLEGLGSKPKLIGTSDTPGALMRVSAGTYKIVSRYLPGNSVAEATARVQPGMISPVEIDHNAGIASLFAVHAVEAKPVNWVVTDADGQVVAMTDERRPSLVLRSGTYTATATAAGVGKFRKFDVKPGDNLKVEVGG